MMSGNDGRKKSIMNPKPIAGIPSTMYSHCHALKPWTPSIFLSTPYAIRPLKQPDIVAEV
jgi:hypothetical protein